MTRMIRITAVLLAISALVTVTPAAADEQHHQNDKATPAVPGQSGSGAGMNRPCGAGSESGANRGDQESQGCAQGDEMPPGMGDGKKESGMGHMRGMKEHMKDMHNMDNGDGAAEGQKDGSLAPLTIDIAAENFPGKRETLRWNS